MWQIVTLWNANVIMNSNGSDQGPGLEWAFQMLQIPFDKVLLIWSMKYMKYINIDTIDTKIMEP